MTRSRGRVYIGKSFAFKVGQFIDALNRRNSEYGQCAFTNGAAGYSLLRAFGERIQIIMGRDQTNRWVIDQVMDIDGPEAVAQLRRSLQKLYATQKPAPKGNQR